MAYMGYCDKVKGPPESCECDDELEGGSDNLEGYIPANRSYFGRGAIQLSWNYNYRMASDALTGDRDTFCSNPDLVASEPEYAWGAGVFFWMETLKEETTCHKKALEGDFGGTLEVINGELECPPGSGSYHEGAIKTRLGRYCKAASAMGMERLLKLDGCEDLEGSMKDCLTGGDCPDCARYSEQFGITMPKGPSPASSPSAGSVLNSALQANKAPASGPAESSSQDEINVKVTVNIPGMNAEPQPAPRPGPAQGFLKPTGKEPAPGPGPAQGFLKPTGKEPAPRPKPPPVQPQPVNVQVPVNPRPQPANPPPRPAPVNLIPGSACNLCLPNQVGKNGEVRFNGDLMGCMDAYEIVLKSFKEGEKNCNGVREHFGSTCCADNMTTQQQSREPAIVWNVAPNNPKQNSNPPPPSPSSPGKPSSQAYEPAKTSAPKNPAELEFPSESYYCGTSKDAAASSCQNACPSGQDSDCPGGLQCFGNTECMHKSSFYCGTSWLEASDKCMHKSSFYCGTS